ncbi:MAG: putative F420-dependent oxidoreductase [Candidatus Azotimanducaceae bacterium]|jgi:probable F420-dependent oxidoreductase
MTTPMGVTFGSLGVLGAPAIMDIAKTAESSGYSSLWTVEANGTDAFSLLGSVAAVAPGLDLATGIIPVQIRSPSLTAMTASTLQALAPTRNIWLGIGVSAPGILQQHGQTATKRPIAMMREYVALLRECMSGESVTFEGDFWSVKRFRLGMRIGERKPKIVMAALNPQMLKLAGEIADGVLLNYLPASHVANSVTQIRKGGDAKIFAYVHAAVSDFERSANSARKDLFNYSMADSYANMFRQAGFADEIDAIRTCHQNRDREGALAAISERMIQAINFIGNADEVTQFVSDYAKAGVEYPILMPMPWGEDRAAVTKATMSAAIKAVG